MNFTRTLRFKHPIDAVWALLGDSDHVRHKYAALGHEGIEVVRWEGDGDGLSTETRRQVPLDVPRFARRVLNPRNTIVQVECWSRAPDGVLTNRWSVDVVGAPIRIDGTARLMADGDGCVHEIQGRVHCSVPLVGGKIAGFVAKDAARGVEDEHVIDGRTLDARG